MRGVVFLLSLSLLGQSPGDTDLLARIRVKVKQNLARLPDYTCIEAIERFTRSKPTDKFVATDRIRLEVAYVHGQELFGWPGAAKIEEPDITKLVSGAIGNGDFAILPESIFFTPSANFDFAGETNLDGKPAIEYQFMVPQEAQTFRIQTGGGKALVGFHGSFWADRASLDLIRIESTVDVLPRRLGLRSGTTILNFGRSTIGSSEFLLPQNSDLVMTWLHGGENRNRVTFQGCRQFSGVSVMKFDEPAVVAAQPAVRTTNLPESFDVEIRLEAQIDSLTATVGDSVPARLLQNIKSGREIVIPKGAQIFCRITILERHGNSYIMSLQPGSFEFEAGRADLTGRENKLAMITMRNGRMFNPATVINQGPQVFPTDHLQIPAGARFMMRSRLLKFKDNDSIRP
jgi:hypothetical protein